MRNARAFWIEGDRWPLWIPVALAAGILAYFAVSTEPHWALVLAAWFISGLALMIFQLDTTSWVARVVGPAEGTGARSLRLILIVTLIVTTGVTLAKWRTEKVAAPVLADELGPVWITALVHRAERLPNGGWRLRLQPTDIERRSANALPAFVRVTARQREMSALPGDMIVVRAVLRPPPDPVAPGAFDFARKAWFDRLGAVGYTISVPRLLDGKGPDVSALGNAQIQVARLRLQLAERVRAGLDGAAGTVAAALMTGDRRAIPQQHVDDLRGSGLAHLLAISGLHMALVGGLIFAATRFALTAIEPLALRWPLKKIAAVVGFFGALGYLILSGASVSTQRAFIMISLVFLAVLFDRPALSMRLVATAATIVMVLRPESVMDVSFQMSFAAVIALVAFYEWYRERRERSADDSLPRSRAERWISKAKLYIGGLILTSLIAELAISPFSAFHFNHLALFGISANLVVMPIVGTVIMPLALLSLLLIPFGLEGLTLPALGWGIDFMLTVAATVSSWPGAERAVPSSPSYSLLLIIFGGLWLCLWRLPWRFAGLVLIGAGLLFGAINQPPDLFIDRQGENISLRNAKGELVSAIARRAGFAVDAWQRRDGRLALADPKAAREELFACDRLGCLANAKDGIRVAYILDERAIEEDCQWADLIIARTALPQKLKQICSEGRVVIDRIDLWRAGAHTVRITKHGMRIDSSAEFRGNRPWTGALKPNNGA